MPEDIQPQDTVTNAEDPESTSAAPADSSVEPGPPTPTLRIEIDHTQYYQWVPVADADVTDDMTTIESTYPGFKMRRATITLDAPTTSVTDVDLLGVAQWNDDREAAGLDRRPHRVNLIQHFVDGPWSRQFPLGSITAIRADDDKWQQWLSDYFIAGDDANYLGGQ